MGRLTLAELERRALERIASGSLPCGPGKASAGFGGSNACALCDLPIDEAEVVYELETETRGGPRTLHFHPKCERAYHAACPSASEPPPP